MKTRLQMVTLPLHDDSSQVIESIFMTNTTHAYGNDAPIHENMLIPSNFAQLSFSWSASTSDLFSKKAINDARVSRTHIPPPLSFSSSLIDTDLRLHAKTIDNFNIRTPMVPPKDSIPTSSFIRDPTLTQSWESESGGRPKMESKWVSSYPSDTPEPPTRGNPRFSYSYSEARSIPDTGQSVHFFHDSPSADFLACTSVNSKYESQSDARREATHPKSTAAFYSSHPSSVSPKAMSHKPVLNSSSTIVHSTRRDNAHDISPHQPYSESSFRSSRTFDNIENKSVYDNLLSTTSEVIQTTSVGNISSNRARLPSRIKLTPIEIPQSDYSQTSFDDIADNYSTIKHSANASPTVVSPVSPVTRREAPPQVAHSASSSTHASLDPKVSPNARTSAASSLQYRTNSYNNASGVRSSYDSKRYDEDTRASQQTVERNRPTSPAPLSSYPEPSPFVAPVSLSPRRSSSPPSAFHLPVPDFASPPTVK